MFCETCGGELTLFNEYEHTRGAEPEWTHTERPPYIHPANPGTDDEG